jgi:hypothetical protein
MGRPSDLTNQHGLAQIPLVVFFPAYSLPVYADSTSTNGVLPLFLVVLSQIIRARSPGLQFIPSPPESS